MRDRLKQRAGKVAAREKRDAAAASKRRRDAADEDGEFAGVDDDFGGGDARKLREAKDAAKAERKRLKAKEAKDDKLREAKAAKDAALVRSSLPAPTRLTADAKRADAAREKADMLTPFEALRQKKIAAKARLDPNPNPNPNPNPAPTPNPNPNPNPNQARFDSAYDTHGKVGRYRGDIKEI